MGDGTDLTSLLAPLTSLLAPGRAATHAYPTSPATLYGPAPGGRAATPAVMCLPDAAESMAVGGQNGRRVI